MTMKKKDEEQKKKDHDGWKRQDDNNEEKDKIKWNNGEIDENDDGITEREERKRMTMKEKNKIK